MRIAFVTSGAYMDQEDYAAGILLGSENQIFALSKVLAAKGHEVSILRRWRVRGIERIDGVNILSVKAHNYRDSRFLLTLSKLNFSRVVSRAVRRMNADLVVVIDPYTSFFLMRDKTPIVLVTHVMAPYGLLPISRLRLGLWDRAIMRANRIVQARLFRKVDAIVALNKQTHEYLENEGCRSVLIPNGIDTSAYVPTFSDNKFVLFAGRLVKAKGVELLLEAYSLLEESLKQEFGLVVVGFGPEEKALRELAVRLGIHNRIEFAPWLPSKEFLNKASKCTVFVLSSLHEMMPVTLLEVMALGKPVIASNIAGSNDVVTDGMDGLLFRAGDVDDLKNHLDQMLRDKEMRRVIGLTARRTVESRFSISKISDEYLALFAELLDNRKLERDSPKKSE